MPVSCDLLIRGGVVVTESAQQHADVAVQGERIAAIGPALEVQARQTIAADNCYVFPGFVDPHVHMSLPVGDMISSDDFASGSIAAACAGTTTIIDFTTQARAAPLGQAVAGRRALADGRVAIDYGLHLTVMDAGRETLRSMRQLAENGYPSVKLYMTYEGLMVRDKQMLSIMLHAAGRDALTMVHAENDTIIRFLRQRLLGAGQRGPDAHALSRPSWVEAEAVGRTIALARAAEAPLYVVHVSCEESLDHIRRARAQGQVVFAETCPHYLLLSEAEYARPGFEGAKYVMTPPLRTPADQAALWGGLADGSIDVVATDHCPWMYATQKARGRTRFDHIPGGIAGVETRAQLMYTEGVAAGRLSLQRFVALMATNPARLFGLHPRKGTLAVGSDADIVIYDPRGVSTLSAARLHQHVDYTVFEGRPVQGRVAATISRGMVVACDGEFVGRIGHGQFVARKV